MFGWWNKKKKEAWSAEDRLLPVGFRNGKFDVCELVLSREFINGARRKRIYMAAVRQKGADDVWVVSAYMRDMKKSPDRLDTAGEPAYARSPEEVIAALKQLEVECKKNDFIPLSQSPPSYISFANAYGLHFDATGETMEIDADAPVMRSTFMTRRTLDEIFLKEQEEEERGFDTWERVYANIVNKPTVEGVDPHDMYESRGWKGFARESEDMLQKLNRLGEYLDKAPSTYQRRMTLRHIIDYVVVDPTVFSKVDNIKTAQHECDATIFVGLLRAGQYVCAERFSKGSLEEKDLDVIKEIGKACAEFAQVRFGLTEEQAAPIADIITQGPDPYAPRWPLDAFMKKAAEPRLEPEQQLAPEAREGPKTESGPDETAIVDFDYKAVTHDNKPSKFKDGGGDGLSKAFNAMSTRDLFDDSQRASAMYSKRQQGRSRGL